MKPVLKKDGHWQPLLVLLVALALCMGMGGVRADDRAPAPLLNTNLLFQSPLPPANDNLADAAAVTALSFFDVVDNTGATGQANEPWGCWGSYEPRHTVWYAYAATERTYLRSSMDGSSFGDTVLTVYQAFGAADGFEDLSYSTCVSYGGAIHFWADPGVTYYFQAMDMWSGGGSLHFNLEQYPSPANDNFKDAAVIDSVPYDGSADMTNAHTETGEPKPSCTTGSQVSKTIWYVFTPTVTQSLTSWAGGDGPFEAVYTGGSLSELAEIGCRAWGGPLNFVADAGQTYYFQVGSLYDAYGWFSFSLKVTPPPSVDFGYWPGDPTIYDRMDFNAWCWDPAEIGIEKQLWDFGDGATAEGCCPTHQYAADGDYTASLTCTTPDGRSGTGGKTILVRTHDVAIARLAAPQSAKAGQTRQLSVEVKNKRYEEPVRVELYRSTTWGFEQIGILTQVVPVRGGNRTTTFAFSYTFTSADATLGKVSFKATAYPQNGRDALPADNDAISSPTKVSR